jgi:hypothetical protein
LSAAKSNPSANSARRISIAEAIEKEALRQTGTAPFIASRFMAAALPLIRQRVAELKGEGSAKAESAGNGAKSLNGFLFQSLVARALNLAGIDPVYPEAFVTFVPVAKYDIVIPTQAEGLVNLSVKTTMRERWKQAEFEGIALKRVHRRSRIYVVNADRKETVRRRNRINECEAIDDFILCDSSDFDALVDAIREWIPQRYPDVPVISVGKRHKLDAQLCEGGQRQRVRVAFGVGDAGTAGRAGSTACPAETKSRPKKGRKTK